MTVSIVKIIKIVEKNIINKLLNIHGSIINIKFLENDNIFECYIPDDQLLDTIKSILILEEYEMLDNFDLSNFREGTIIDAGCHVGLFSIKASTHVKRVICIEAHPINYRLFEINLIKNNIKNIIPMNAALWYKNGPVYLHEGKNTDLHSLIDRKEKIFSDKKIKVNALTLEDITKDYKEIDLLKLDIEGAEFDIILNMSNECLRKFKRIVGEIHLEYENRLDDVVKKLECNGFDITFCNPYDTYRLDKIFKNWKKINGRTMLKILLTMVCIVYGVMFNIFPKPQYLKILYAQRKEE